MKAATIHELKQELLTLCQKELAELCQRLGKLKKENKVASKTPVNALSRAASEGVA